MQDYVHSFVNSIDSNEEEPRSYKQAISPEYCEKWLEPIQKEYKACILNKTWTELHRHDIPIGVQLHRPIWRFKSKTNGVNKARLCFDGRFQMQGFDFHETYSPVAKYPSVRLALATILALGGTIELGDVPNAFLNADVDADVYMEMPEGFNDDPNIVCKLNKSLYGLKQAAMLWHSAIDNHLTSSMGFSRLPDDRCIYVKGDSSDFVIVILYVDDIAIGSNKQSHIDSAFAALTDRFMIKRLGPLHNSQYLGMTVNISEDGSTIKMTQPHAIQKLLSKYKLESTTPTKSPFNPKVVLTKDNGDPINDITRYRSLIGGLFWIA